MKKVLALLLFMVVACWAAAHNYAEHSAMQNGRWIKLSVDQSGLYRIPYSTLQNQGISPATARIYGYGGAMLTQDFSKNKIDDLPEIAVYDNGNALVFYAQGPVSWSYTSSSKMLTHTRNPYAMKGYYFISDAGNGSPKRIGNATPLTSSSYTVNTFTDYALHEEELVNLIDTKGESGGGREWYGELLTPGSTLTINFNFPNVVTSKKMMASWMCAAAGTVSSKFQLTAGSTTQTMTLDAIANNQTSAIATTRRNEYTPTGDQMNFQLAYLSSHAGCKGYLNYVEVNATRQLTMSQVSGPLYFRNTEHIGNGSNSLYQLAGATTATQVWDITDPANMERISTSANGSTLQFIAGNQTLRELVAIDTTTIGALPTPTIVGNVPNQDLHALRNIQYVIITNEAFTTAANRLAALHATEDDMTTAVVTDQQIYNEFSSGTPDATAYRWLMKMLYDRYNNNGGLAPKYLVLMGDGTFDNRHLLQTSGTPYLLTYQAINSTEEPAAYATDDYFTWLDNNEGNSDRQANMDVAVGRIPVQTAAEANQYVNKVDAYIHNNNYSNWRNQIVFLADDGDLPNLLHTWQADSVYNYIKHLIRPFQTSRIYEEANNQEVTASGESYPLAKNQFDNLMNNGTILMNYTGHGSAHSITSESMLDKEIVRNMSNTNQGLWVLATCSFAHFDQRTSSIAEDAVLNPSGGAIAVFSPCRTVYASMNLELNKQVSSELFTKTNGDYPTIGEAMQRGKNNISNNTARNSADQYNRLPYTLLGDPLVRLHYPHPYQVITDSINHQAVSTADTLRALQGVCVSGYIADADGNQLTDFNGDVNLQFFDKATKVVCKDNDKVLDENAYANRYSYYDHLSVLFKGSANVTDGRFAINLMLPKDIRYNYGNGRFIYYAHDTLTHAEANGYYEDMIVGGSYAAATTEEDGPDVTIYLNNASFVNGGKVNTTPTFFAEISDATGISTSGSGIGHDLLLMVDNDPEQSYVLNDYFQTGNSFKDGSLVYKFAALEEGKHTLLFRAWDLLNNSTTKTLDFEVVSGLKPNIISVVSYPNPVRASGMMTFVINHDRPNTALEAELLVFDLAGRRVYSQTQNGADQLQWNVGQSGVPAGVYLYQVRVKSNDSTYATKASKLIIQ